ncbi:MAG: sigma-70 family RNA polymerase sigma factor [Anaerohalosphaera sp.]|nr:sigma-70 family RNA polymerase sigma factor [Anaerohalosphaera sp.]
MAKYKNSSLDQFFNELKFAPVQRQHKELIAANDLLAILDLQLEYPLEIICFRITEYRPRQDMSGILIKGDILANDLRIFIDRLSAKLAIPAADQNQKVYSIGDICEKFSVSRKTVQRWRKQGLIGWTYLFPDNRKAIGFLASVVDDFIDNNKLSSKKAEAFTKLTPSQKAKIVDLAKQNASRSDSSRHRIIIEIAQQMNRSRETIRCILADYEKDFPDDTVFNKPAGVIGPKEAGLMYKMHKQGAKIGELMEKFNRSRSSIHRIINKRRAKALLGLKIDFIQSDDFQLPDADRIILADNALIKKLSAARTPKLLTRQQETELFRRYNYLKYLACSTRENVSHISPSGTRLKKVEKFLTASEEIKKLIVEANLGLVVSVAQRHAKYGASMPDLVSEGNISLMHAVDKFDYSRGYRFSTYASLVIAKEYAKSDTSTKGTLEQSSDMSNIELDLRNVSQVDVASIERAHYSLDEVIRNNLTEREQYVIRNHFGLDGNRIVKNKMTLVEIGEKLNLTKERVRQIELIALQQLRHCLAPEEFDVLIS